jgi:hypothetical protein
MSEITDDIADGTICSKCLIPFEDPEDPAKVYTHGYPVACKVCFRAGMKREGIQKATVKTL